MRIPAKYLILLFVLIEVALFVVVGDLLGVGVTILLVVVTTVFGIILQRRSGLGMMMKMAQNMQAGKPGPMPGKMPSPFNTVAALLLIIPGFLTDLIGLLLLVPFLQRRLQGFVMKFAGRMPGMSPGMAPNFGQPGPGAANTSFQPDSAHRVIDGEVVDKEP